MAMPICAITSLAWLHSDSGVRSCPTARRVTCTSWTGWSPTSHRPEPRRSAEGWIVPGLVDAHCHVGLDENGAVDEETIEQQAITDRDAGALLLRDCGSAADTPGSRSARTCRGWCGPDATSRAPSATSATSPTRSSRPSSPTYVAQEAQRGDGWVKLVGDWIDRDTGDLEPSFPDDAFAEAIRVAHEHGAKVTAHCFGEKVLPGLIGAGIDCIEHGTGLSEDLIDEMVERGTSRWCRR